MNSTKERERERVVSECCEMMADFRHFQSLDFTNSGVGQSEGGDKKVFIYITNENNF